MWPFISIIVFSFSILLIVFLSSAYSMSWAYHPVWSHSAYSEFRVSNAILVIIVEATTYD